MAEYIELIERLRNHAKSYEEMFGEGESSVMMRDAADAIEELVRKEKFHAFLWNTIQPNEMEQYISMYNAGNEKAETK